ncbi:hypothetical protein BC938DRAFT_474320, partial [Jimgerdemannia flammicorona]
MHYEPICIDVKTSVDFSIIGSSKSDARPSSPLMAEHTLKAMPTVLAVLEAVSNENRLPNGSMKERLENKLQMTVRAVQVWFQNWKKKMQVVRSKDATFVKTRTRTLARRTGIQMTFHHPVHANQSIGVPSTLIALFDRHGTAWQHLVVSEPSHIRENVNTKLLTQAKGHRCIGQWKDGMATLDVVVSLEELKE